MADFFLGNKGKIDFQDLMPNRVHEILLVASPYDAFILEEDGHLTEQILTEYIGMNFNYAPRVTRVSKGNEALEIIKNKKFDLIIVMLRIEDQDPITLGSAIKELYPKKPVILLVFDETELKQLPDLISPKSIDRVFIWSGDASVFPAIIKYVEDRKNAKQDILKGDVRAILIIEDSPRMYSILLPLIYKEIMYQTKNLVDTTLSQSSRLLHLRARAKILLTPNFETAQRLYRKYRKNMIGIISDVRFPKKGIKDSKAGYEFSKWVRNTDSSIPILLQSTGKENKEMTKETMTTFLDKNSPTLLNDLRKFMIKNFGFGDFIFVLPNNKEIARATNLDELRNAILTIPEKSLLYHAKSHHFSNWLAARTEFELASKLRPVFVEEFKSGEHLRKHLLLQLANVKELSKNYPTKNYSQWNDDKIDFSRLCGGSLGGKARGLGFARSMITESGIREKFSGITIRVPKCTVIGTDEFDRFMKDNKLWEKALHLKDDKKLEKLFLKSKLSIDVMLKLESFIKENKKPLAIRSSSLLEDSQYQPLAGTYETFMLPNNSKSNKKRLNDIIKAIKKVYASTFKGEAKTLLDNTAHRIEEEKMAVIIQEIVGQTYSNNRFYPSFSGVLKSINYYPISYMKRTEGVAYLALGFGRTIVDGEKCLRISPKYPSILPQFFSMKSTQENSQNHFYALPLKNQNVSDEDLKLYSLKVSEEDGSLKWLGSVISNEDNNMRDSLLIKGTRVVSFAPILKWETIPFSGIAQEILKIGKKALGCPVEIEFAVNLLDNGKHEFCLLQIKPMVLTGLQKINQKEILKAKDIFCRSSITLGDGKIDNIKDFIIVRPSTFDISKTAEIAKEVGIFNSKFKLKEHFILCGSGRWGSADPWLGIPVNWEQISQAKAIIELGREDMPIDPSFGSHFFQNITSLRVAYFTISHKKRIDSMNIDWIEDKNLYKKGEFIDWYKFDEQFTITLDGTSGLGLIQRPKKLTIELMDEEESSGI